MTLFSALAAAAFSACAANGPVFHSALEAGGKPWTFALEGAELLVTPPGEKTPSQRLEVHVSDSPPDHPVLETEDFDFDGRKDVRLLLAKHVQGQSVWQYWLFDAAKRRLVPSPALDATLNARPDTRGGKGLLSSYWNGGAAGRIYKRTTYRWERGALVVVEQEEQTELPGKLDDFHRVVKKDGKVVDDSVVHDPR